MTITIILKHDTKVHTSQSNHSKEYVDKVNILFTLLVVKYITYISNYFLQYLERINK